MRGKRVDGKKVGINWEMAEKSLSGHHRTDEFLNSNIMVVAQSQLQQAIAEGRHSSEKKLRRAINQAIEARLAIRASWCRTCLAYLTDCTCPVAPIRYRAPSFELIARIQERLAAENQERKVAIKEDRKRRKIEARRLRKLGATA